MLELEHIIYLIAITSAAAYTWYVRSRNRKSQDELKDHILKTNKGITIEDMVFSHNGETAFFVLNGSFHVIRIVDGEFDDDCYSVQELRSAQVYVDNLRAGELLSDFNIDLVASMWKKHRNQFTGDSDNSCAMVVKFVVKEQPPLGLNQLEILDTDSVGKGRLNLNHGLRNLVKVQTLINSATSEIQKGVEN